jgi:ribosomal protein S12 methylthiotransferase accessory factor YcaO
MTPELRRCAVVGGEDKGASDAAARDSNLMEALKRSLAQDTEAETKKVEATELRLNLYRPLERTRRLPETRHSLPPPRPRLVVEIGTFPAQATLGQVKSLDH